MVLTTVFITRAMMRLSRAMVLIRATTLRKPMARRATALSAPMVRRATNLSKLMARKATTLSTPMARRAMNLKMANGKAMHLSIRIISSQSRARAMFNSHKSSLKVALTKMLNQA